jgi:prevent-host-death family protein
MIEIGVFEAKDELGALLDQVEAGEEIVITRQGRPVARLVPAVPRNDRAGAREAAAELRALAREIGGPAFDWDEVKAWRDEGRR